MAQSLRHAFSYEEIYLSPDIDAHPATICTALRPCGQLNDHVALSVGDLDAWMANYTMKA